VQGADAPAQIVAALNRLNTHTQVDVILVIRGGGSIEDLWAFNVERVARAIAGSRIPVITGVGHETDFTIADFVSDLRAPTPSAAAELATPNLDNIRADLDDLDKQITALLHDRLTISLSDLSAARRALGHVSPASRIRNLRQRVDDWNLRLSSQQRGRIKLWRERLTGRTAALNAANPDSILSRGYAIVYRSEDRQRLSAAAGTEPGTGISIRFQDGELKARVEDKDSHERYKRTLF
jgi:exodeoxyribonuclease VII large subunit